MKKILLILFALPILLSCANKSHPENHNQAINILNTATNNLLSGKKSTAENGYNRAVEKFVKAGDFCNASRAGILLFTSDPKIENISFINDAKKYSDNGDCIAEQEIVKLAYNLIDNVTNIDTKTDISYDIIKLEQPYKDIAKYKQTNDLTILKDLIKSTDISDRTRTYLLRIIALSDKSSNLKVAEDYILLARDIDARHSWTLNLLYDNIILRDIYIDANKNIDQINEQILSLENAINNK